MEDTFVRLKLPPEPGDGLGLERITIEHPNAESAFPDSRTLGPIDVSAVQGTVLGAFTPGSGQRGG